MKICSICCRELDESCFTKNKASKDGLMSYCRDCLKVYNDKRKFRKKIEPPKYKRCSKCHRIIEINTFAKNSTNKDGYEYTCKDCSKERMLKYKERMKIEGKSGVDRIYNKNLEQEKMIVCQRCGKEFIIKRSKRTGDFSQQKYCDDCLGKKQTKVIYCKKCGKPFKVERCGGYGASFKIRKYCDDCMIDGKPTKTRICQLCGKEFEVGRSVITGAFLDRKLCDVCFYTSIESIPEKKFGDLLKEYNIEYTREFNLDNKYYYDFHILNTNILIELNPTFSHTFLYNGFYNPKDKNYHYNKSLYAIKHGYICICVWDWDNWNDIINLIKQPNLKMEYIGIKLIYSKSKEKINSENITNTDDIISQGYLPIYTDGFEVIPITML